MHFTSFINDLQYAFTHTLPGIEAHKEMTGNVSRTWKIPVSHRKSAVLVCLYEKNGEIFLVFIRRTKDGKAHSGQISLPGGRMDPHDADLIHTALREAQEEVNIQAKEVHIIGNLTEIYIPVSNFLVYPTVGYLPYKPLLIPEPNEVDLIIEAPLMSFFEEKNYSTISINFKKGISFQAPAFIIKGHTIWGATAMIMNEFLYVVKKVLPAN